jgi:rare lipoprotein A
MRKRRSHATAVLFLVTMLAGCNHHKQARVDVPAPPPIPSPPPVASAPQKTASTPKAPAPAAEPAEKSAETPLSVPPDTVPILTETGMASWYGAPYHNRRSSNGEIYNMNAMTAAHRTLPLGSVVRVTNVKTGQSALLKITDRGPFVDGRIIDVSYAAAKTLDIWQPGVARVKLEVLLTPVAIATGGRWAVQIGSFGEQKEASDMAAHLARRYQTAKVDKFLSPVGDWWVRVRVQGDDRQRAEALAHETETPVGSVYLVRLD